MAEHMDFRGVCRSHKTHNSGNTTSDYPVTIQVEKTFWETSEDLKNHTWTRRKMDLSLSDTTIDYVNLHLNANLTFTHIVFNFCSIYMSIHVEKHK